MTKVQTIAVSAAEADLRLDRWFKRRYPDLTHGRLEKLLRTGQVRVDGRRAQSNLRLKTGQQIRVPPLGEAPARPPRAAGIAAVTDSDARVLQAAVLYRDEDVLVLNKPSGLAVQGGTGLSRHLDAMLDALRFDATERPRLVHRLDRDTSGVLLLARHAQAAAELTAAFRRKDCRKTYWAIVVGVPKPERGRIDLALAKLPGRAGERMEVDEEGKEAVTEYSVVDRAGGRAAWLELLPLTGRTHQLRAHCAALGTPILGDAKYGGPGAFLGLPGMARRLHLHAQRIRLPRPDGRWVDIAAPPPEHMVEDGRSLGFQMDSRAKHG